MKEKTIIRLSMFIWIVFTTICISYVNQYHIYYQLVIVILCVLLWFLFRLYLEFIAIPEIKRKINLKKEKNEKDN